MTHHRDSADHFQNSLFFFFFVLPLGIQLTGHTVLLSVQWCFGLAARSVSSLSGDVGEL